MTKLPNKIAAFSSWMSGIEAQDLYDMDKSDVLVLLAVHAHPTCTISQIAGMIRSSHSGAVRIADRLQAQGYISRHRGDDRRFVTLRTTSEGNTRASSILRQRTLQIEERINILDEDEISMLDSILSKLLEGAASEEIDAWRICKFCDHQFCEQSICPVGGKFHGKQF